MGLPSILDKCTRKSQPLPKDTTTDPKDSGGNVQLTDKVLPSTASNEGTSKTMLRPEGSLGDKDSGGNKLPVDMEQSNILLVNPSRTGAEYQESDEEEVFAVGDGVKYLRKVSRFLFSKITQEQWAQHKEVVVSYADLKASIEGDYEENIAHRDQTNKLVEASMSSLDKIRIVIRLKSLVESLKVDALRQDEHLASWAKLSNSLAWNLGLKMTAVKSSQAEIKSDISSLKQDTSEIKSMMTEIFIPSKVTLQPPQAVCHRQDLLSLKGQQMVPYMINVKMHYLTDDKINAYLVKEDKIKKAVKEAKMLEMNRTEVIKVVQEEAKKIRLDPKIIKSGKAGEKFKKA
ncbi:hypothetical protein Tco_1191748 [Tanacetum coccineum]